MLYFLQDGWQADVWRVLCAWASNRSLAIQHDTQCSLLRCGQQNNKDIIKLFQRFLASFTHLLALHFCVFFRQKIYIYVLTPSSEASAILGYSLLSQISDSDSTLFYSTQARLAVQFIHNGRVWCGYSIHVDKVRLNKPSVQWWSIYIGTNSH